MDMTRPAWISEGRSVDLHMVVKGCVGGYVDSGVLTQEVVSMCSRGRNWYVKERMNQNSDRKCNKI